MNEKILPIPAFYLEENADKLRQISYSSLAKTAGEWRKKYEIEPAYRDSAKIGLLLIDLQNTFCLPGFELFVAGQSGNDAVEDSRRLCRFLYKNLSLITEITATLDTHSLFQVFHPNFIVDKNGTHPRPMTEISYDEVKEGKWTLNPQVRHFIKEADDNFLLHYTKQLEHKGRSKLTIWPYHAMLGGVGHNLVSIVEEAVFFHSAVRNVPANISLKGDHPLTENYSAIKPEVCMRGEAPKQFLQKLFRYDKLIIAGQAKSHCVKWTILDLLEAARQQCPEFISKIYILEDCMSCIVTPDYDFNPETDEIFDDFRQQGVHPVKSQTPIDEWPGFLTEQIDNRRTRCI